VSYRRNYWPIRRLSPDSVTRKLPWNWFYQFESIGKTAWNTLLRWIESRIFVRRTGNFSRRVTKYALRRADECSNCGQQCIESVESLPSLDAWLLSVAHHLPKFVIEFRVMFSENFHVGREFIGDAIPDAGDSLIPAAVAVFAGNLLAFGFSQ